MATKRQRANGTWEFRVTRKNLLPKPIYRTFDDEDAGIKYMQRLEDLLDQGIIPEGFIDEQAATIGQLIDEYLNNYAIKPDDLAILQLINKRDYAIPVDEMTYHWAENWVTRMKREEHKAPTTIRHYVGALARCLDWALAKEYLKINPLRQLPKGYATYNNKDQQYVTAREDRQVDRRFEGREEQAIRDGLAELCDEADEMLLLFDIALESAMRLSEIHTLSWEQVDFQQSTIFLDKTKNGHKRQVPMSTVLINTLEPVRKNHGEIFPWPARYRRKFTMLPPKAIQKKVTALLSKRFNRLCRDLGIDEFTFHCLRHEATSRLFERTNLTDTEIMKITGHSSTRMLARYANLRGSTLAARLW